MGEKANNLVCVVDDDDDVRESLRALLEAFGYSVLAFSSAPDLLAFSGIADAACLLFDFQMPAMNGVELMEHLRRRKIAIPVILLTATTHKLEARIARAGVFAVLKKPVDSDALLACVAKACARPTR